MMFCWPAVFDTLSFGKYTNFMQFTTSHLKHRLVIKFQQRFGTFIRRTIRHYRLAPRRHHRRCPHPRQNHRQYPFQRRQHRRFHQPRSLQRLHQLPTPPRAYSIFTFQSQICFKNHVFSQEKKTKINVFQCFLLFQIFLKIYAPSTSSAPTSSSKLSPASSSPLTLLSSSLPSSSLSSLKL